MEKVYKHLWTRGNNFCTEICLFFLSYNVKNHSRQSLMNWISNCFTFCLHFFSIVLLIITAVFHIMPRRSQQILLQYFSQYWVIIIMNNENVNSVKVMSFCYLLNAFLLEVKTREIRKVSSLRDSFIQHFPFLA